MEGQLSLVADTMRRKLPQADIEPGEHTLAGTALVDLDCKVAKSAPTEAQPNLPWKSIVAALVPLLGKSGVETIVAAARKVCRADKDTPLPAELEAALDKVRAKQKPVPREGPTKVTGTVELVGFAAAELVLPGWREVRDLIIGGNRTAGRVS